MFDEGVTSTLTRVYWQKKNARALLLLCIDQYLDGLRYNYKDPKGAILIFFTYGGYNWNDS